MPPHDLVATNSPLDFGPVVVGSRRRDWLQWRNSTNAVVPVGGVDPAASPDGAFRAAAPAGHGNIPAYDTAQAVIDFSPPGMGTFSATFDLVLGPGKTCEGGVVQGEGVAHLEEGSFELEPLFHQSDGPLDCGVVPVDGAGTAVFNLHNTSGAPIPVTTTWDTGQVFSLASPLTSLPEGSIIKADGSMFDGMGEAITVVFTPKAEGLARDVLHIKDDTVVLLGPPLHSFTIAVLGIGVKYGDSGAFTAAAAGIGETLAFGNVIVGNSRWSAFYVTNDLDVEIAFVARLLAGNQGFSIDAPNPRPASIKAHDQLGFVIGFTPPAVGDFKDTLVIASPDGRHVVARHLTGTGVPGM